MIRKSVLATLLLSLMLALTSIPAGASSRQTQKVYKSRECTMSVTPYDFASWACTTITVPTQMNAGGTATVTFQFKAKKTLKYVDVCFGKINSATCAYRHKYTTINKGAMVKRVLRMRVPTVAESGTYSLDNYTKFYRLPKYADPNAYWTARAFLCIVSADQADFQCPLGK